MTVIDRIKRVQRNLEVEDDGVIGPVTLTAMETKLGIQDVHMLQVSRLSLDKLVEFETGGEAYYRQKLQRPTWPGVESGITIGVGYDLGYHTKKEVREDWGGRISDADVARLLTVTGLKRDAARTRVASVRDVRVSFEVAKEVFWTTTLPKFAVVTAGVFPGIDALPHDAQGALLSLVFNRGAAMSGARRREMRAIREVIEYSSGEEDLHTISNQILSMKRLWPNVKGLLRRRDEEAKLVRESQRSYNPNEIVEL